MTIFKAWRAIFAALAIFVLAGIATAPAYAQSSNAALAQAQALIAANPDGGADVAAQLAAIIAANPELAAQIIAMAEASGSPAIVMAVAAAVAQAQAQLAASGNAAGAAVLAQAAANAGADFQSGV